MAKKAPPGHVGGSVRLRAAIHPSSTFATSTEASALATAPVAVLGARLQWAPRDPPATLFVRAADLAAAAAADAGDAVARTLDMLVGDGTVGP